MGTQTKKGRCKQAKPAKLDFFHLHDDVKCAQTCSRVLHNMKYSESSIFVLAIPSYWYILSKRYQFSVQFASLLGWSWRTLAGLIWSFVSRVLVHSIGLSFVYRADNIIQNESMSIDPATQLHWTTDVLSSLQKKTMLESMNWH